MRQFELANPPIKGERQLKEAALTMLDSSKQVHTELVGAIEPRFS